MGTDITPEISKRSPHYIPKHRYYELKHFSLQYLEWKKELAEIDTYSSKSLLKVTGDQVEFKDPTFDISDRRTLLSSNVSIVERAAKLSDPVCSKYILEAVTTGASWNYIKMVRGYPKGKNSFYQAYRKYFYYLDKLRRT